MSLSEPSNAPSCRVMSFLPPPSGQRMKADAVYLQDQFFKITTDILRRLKTSLPRQWDEGSEAISCSSCQKLLAKGTGGSWFKVFLDPFSLFFLLAPRTLCLPQCILAHKAHRQTLKSRRSLWAPDPLLHCPLIPEEPTAR